MNPTLPKDVYEHITKFADDKTILQMLKANKQLYYDETLFERIIDRKYPLLKKFKNPNESWKDLYLRKIKYIYKLEEEYGIPYIPTKGYDPEHLYKPIFNRNISIYDDAMYWAALGGHINIAKLMIEKGAKDFNVGMRAATERGYIDIVKLMIEKGAVLFNFILVTSSGKGYLNIVKLMIEKGATDFHNALIAAKGGGHEDIANYLKQFIQ